MVKLKFVVKDDNLVLRISEGKERFYRSTSSIVTGNPNLSRHWDPDKEKFKRNAQNSKENNEALELFKRNYSNAIVSNPGMTAKEISTIFDRPANKPAEKVRGEEYVSAFLEKVIAREKCKQGCNFEAYHKLLLKSRKLIPDLDSLKFSQIDFDKCVEIAGIFAQHKGYFCSMKVFRNMLGKAAKDRDVKFKIWQIGDFKFRDYDPEKDVVKTRKPDVLTQSQIKAFMDLDLDTTTPTFKNRDTVKLYHNFCIFMLHTMMAPCDVIKLKMSDISREHTFVTRRKKTHHSVEVPISPVLDHIIAECAKNRKNGYIFPIMDDSKSKLYKTKDYLFKNFRENLNIWLKAVGREIGVGYPLYAYVFRHTAITLALDSGLPISYVASVAGTSIEMIQKHYYNADSQQNSQKLKAAFLRASGKI